MRLHRFGTLSLLMAGLYLAFAGCTSGPPKVVVKGKISDGGKIIPVKMTESKAGQKLRVYLKSADAGTAADNWEANINIDDGTFVIAGGDGRGMPHGKYKVFVVWMDQFPGGKDLLNGKFSEANSKIIREIPPSGGELIIDVSKPEG